MLYLRDLPETGGPTPPHPLLYCPACSAEYSACRGDYFWMPGSRPFRCQHDRTPLVLVTKHTILRPVVAGTRA